jgi:hypothetical protein
MSPTQNSMLLGLLPGDVLGFLQFCFENIKCYEKQVLRKRQIQRQDETV